MTSRYEIAPRQAYALATAIIANLLLPHLLLPYRVEMLQWSLAAYWCFNATVSWGLPLLCIFVLARRFSLPPSAYLPRFPPRFDSDLIALCTMASLLLMAAYWPVSQIAWRFLGPHVAIPAHSLTDTLPTGFLFLPTLILVTALASFFESVIFIAWPWALLCNRCQQVLPKSLFALLSAAAFGAAHLQKGLPETLATFSFGLVAVLIFFKLRDLWPVIVGHGLMNLILLSG